MDRAAGARLLEQIRASKPGETKVIPGRARDIERDIERSFR